MWIRARVIFIFYQSYILDGGISHTIYSSNRQRFCHSINVISPDGELIVGLGFLEEYERTEEEGDTLDQNMHSSDESSRIS
jgi:hypothetical protein